MKYYTLLFCLLCNMLGLSLLAQEQDIRKRNISPIQVHSWGEKMNVFYTGVENNFIISTNIPVQYRKVMIRTISSGEASIKAIDITKGYYRVTATSTGSVEVVMIDIRSNKEYSKLYRIKRIPNPIPSIAMNKGGVIGVEKFTTALGIIPLLENFDFAARCKITNYKLIIYNKKGQKKEIEGGGNRFIGTIETAIKKAKGGDVYIFNEIDCKCPGDKTKRRINSLVFEIE